MSQMVGRASYSQFVVDGYPQDFRMDSFWISIHLSSQERASSNGFNTVAIEDAPAKIPSQIASSMLALSKPTPPVAVVVLGFATGPSKTSG
jgi:hypothetical protein